ncbi:MAG: hypothetical protein U5L96_19400 [Owenweeksia sp.]|nr:hypothetical protein [Owenweeksia sp.]
MPYLPIRFFKSHAVLTGRATAREVFTSSGTTGSVPSRHFVRDLGWYEEFCQRGFAASYGPIDQYCVLALLPSYLERQGSSLVYMARQFIAHSLDEDSGFYLDEYEALHHLLLKKIKLGQKELVMGVTFGLLDFAERYQLPPNHCIIMETGGMKGRRKEMTRAEVHRVLRAALGVSHIHSEYGMTELLSQAYSRGAGRFSCSPWMRYYLPGQRSL